MRLVCFRAASRGGPGRRERVLAVRAGDVNFTYVRVGRGEWVGTVSVPRRVYLAVVDDGSRLLARELEGGWYVGYVEGYVADFPYPPLPDEEWQSWSRFVTVEAGGGPASINLMSLRRVASLDGERSLLGVVTQFDAFAVVVEDLRRRRDAKYFTKKYLRFYMSPPLKTGRDLTGEEYRVKEVEGDYLRLVGRGKDEYLAWDFVLGTLDTGEWVLFSEDGLYKASLSGDRVVVADRFRDVLFKVRGPPYSPFYPVVPVRWVRERLERAAELARRLGADCPPEVYTPPVDPEVLLKWPLRNVQWAFRVVPEVRPPGGGDVVQMDCRELCVYFPELCAASPR